MRLPDLIEGRLLKRYKRFLADVELADGSIITAHCPNTGAMTGCALPGSPVWLSVSDSKTRKYPHTWELVQTPNGLACIHSAKANTVVKEALLSGAIPGFEAYPHIRSEAKYGQSSRADLLLEGADKRVYIEVKSVTLCEANGQGLFPDAVSARGRKHLQELRAICDSDTRAVMLFCVFHEGVTRVSCAGAIDPLYTDAMREAIASGVEVFAWGAQIDLECIQLAQPLPFTVDPEDCA